MHRSFIPFRIRLHYLPIHNDVVMAALLRRAVTAAALHARPSTSTARLAAPQLAAWRPVRRTLATVVDNERTEISSSSSAPGANTTAKGDSFELKEDRYHVREPQKSTVQAPRYSRHSSRVVGRDGRKRKYLRKHFYETNKDRLLKIYLPSVFIRLVRNTGAHRDDPYTATFRTDIRLSKPDIAAYLRSVYGLEFTSIRTIIYRTPRSDRPLERRGTPRTFKKVLITMRDPFVYPAERSRQWCNEYFERDAGDRHRMQKYIATNDGQKYGIQSRTYRGTPESEQAIAEQARRVEEGGTDEALLAAPGDGTAARFDKIGIKRKPNIKARQSRERTQKRASVDETVARLRAEGW